MDKVNFTLIILFLLCMKLSGQITSNEKYAYYQKDKDFHLNAQIGLGSARTVEYEALVLNYGIVVEKSNNLWAVRKIWVSDFKPFEPSRGKINSVVVSWGKRYDRKYSEFLNAEKYLGFLLGLSLIDGTKNKSSGLFDKNFLTLGLHGEVFIQALSKKYFGSTCYVLLNLNKENSYVGLLFTLDLWI